MRTAYRTFVLISTDKAVNPKQSSRAPPSAWRALWRRRPPRPGRFCAVRFANVLGSEGSVVPLFPTPARTWRAAHGDAPEATPLYFMTIPERSRCAPGRGHGNAGARWFLLDMGEPVKVLDSARQLSGSRACTRARTSISCSRGCARARQLHEELHSHAEQARIDAAGAYPALGPPPGDETLAADGARARNSLARRRSEARRGSAATPPVSRAALAVLVPEYTDGRGPLRGWPHERGVDPITAAGGRCPRAPCCSSPSA